MPAQMAPSHNDVSSRRFSNCRAELAQADPNSEARVLQLLTLNTILIPQVSFGFHRPTAPEGASIDNFTMILPLINLQMQRHAMPGCKGPAGRNGPIRQWPFRRPARRPAPERNETWLGEFGKACGAERLEARLMWKGSFLLTVFFFFRPPTKATRTHHWV